MDVKIFLTQRPSGSAILNFWNSQEIQELSPKIERKIMKTIKGTLTLVKKSHFCLHLTIGCSTDFLKKWVVTNWLPLYKMRRNVRQILNLGCTM